MKTSRHPLRRRSRAARAAGALLVLLLELGVFNKPLTAGDILRGGATSGAPVGASNPVGTAPPAITPNGGTTRDSLARTAMAIQAMQAMQQSARNLANQGANHVATKPSGSVLPDVPDGIGKGGLQVDPRVTGQANDPLWTGASAPTQTTKTGGGTQVTIVQSAQQAVLNWETFNVGKNTTLTFDQSAGGANAGQWIAFNKVNDPTANPTQILGSIQAPGQVYIINRNGIIFGGSSQVNVHTLVASSLSINDDLVKQGLLNNPTNKFLFSGIGGDASTKVGDIVVEAGAQLTAPTSAEKVGGRIALIGANVTNDGTISTTDGQTILAAGLEVGLVAHATTDPSLRGLDTYIGAVVDPASTLSGYAGTATNGGLIEAGRADVTIAGKNVQQLGVINSSTSVSFNGRIDLLANYDAIGNQYYDSTVADSPTFMNRSVGTVTLGEGSVTQILPELASKETVIGSVLALPSQINIQGNEIHFDDNSILYAPNANVAVNAGSWYTIPAPGPGAQLTYQFMHDGGRIDLDSGALIDVSGSKDVQSSVTSNIVAVELRGSELADSPLLRDGALRGQTIYVDITQTGTYNGKSWVGTPLADVSGYANLVQRTVGELTAAGGTVKLDAGGAVVIRSGANIDVSGGTVNYAGGVVQTSRVIAGDKIFDVADATPDRVYDGVYKGGSITTSSAWGVTQQYVNPIAQNGSRYQDGFVQGGNGGTLGITSGAVAVDGTLKGTTYTGVRQRTIGPVASTLNITFAAERLLAGAVSSYSPNATSVLFSNNNAQQSLADYAVDGSGTPLPVPAERLEKLVLSPDLLGANGFGNLSVKSPDGNITVEQGVTLETAPRGSISLAGANVDIEGSVIAAGGTLSFTAYDISPDLVAELKVDTSAAALPAVDPSRGNFTLGSQSTLSTAGYLVDDRPTSATLLQTPLVTTGGTIKITSLSADLAMGSLVDVSGGVVATAGGKYTYGNAGAISILTGKDASLGGVFGGELHLGGELRGMSGAKGGSLTVQAAAVQVGGASAAQGVLHLDSDFFNQGGFASFAVNGIGREDGQAVLVTADAHVAPVVSSWLASEVDGAISLDTYVQDAGLRSTASLSFGGIGASNDFRSGLLIVRGDVKVDEGAVIDAGAAGSIKLSGETVEVQGSLLAAGGAIQINGADKLHLPDNGIATGAGTTVWIGSSAVIDASGTTLLVPDSFGRRRGAVLDGGSISVTGNVVADAGALLDVSGTSGTLDLLPGESGQSLADLAYGASGTTSRPYAIRGKSTRIDSDGGTITLAGTEMLFSDATLSGSAGGASGSGGTLSVSSGSFLLVGEDKFPNAPTLVLTQSGDVLPASFSSGIGTPGPADSTGVRGGGRFAVDRFTEGGFANLDLGGVVKATGPISITANGRVTLGDGPVFYADSTVSVNASHVVLGAPFKTPRQSQENQEDYLVQNIPVRMPATYGAGSLSVSGDLIDVGDLSLQGIGSANLVAANGDIRGSGTLAIAGDLSLTAGQIYPPTDLRFTIAAFDYQSGGQQHSGSVTITGSGTRSLPLSAGGTLAIYGSTIVQNGVLRAPFGNIILGWDGTGTAPVDLLTGGNISKTTEIKLGSKSVTSVSAIDPITGKGVTIPYGVSVDGTTWLDPAGNDITSGGLPQKSITLSGESVVSEAGSKVDIRGGGDLLAYRFVAGNGGSEDILASSGSFAVVPGYSAEYSPYAPFSTSSAASALGDDAGYVNSSLQVGQQIYLNGSSGLPAGVYTLLPARYALLPGAYLVTPQSGAAIGTVAKADGSKIVSGYLINGLEDGVSAPPVSTRFEVASSKVVNTRAEYTQFLANTFLTSTGGFRLPGDSGQLVFSATKAMTFDGQILSAASGNFRGGLIDISSAGDILISNGSTAPPAAGTLVLDANLISGFGAESILIGGVRSAESDGTLVTVTTGTVTLDNAGAALTGPEIILAAQDGVVLKDGSQIKQNGKSGGIADTLIIGSQLAAGATPGGTGNGALVRVNHGDGGSLIRRDVISGQNVSLSVGSGASLIGDSITLDSTGDSSLGSGANLTAANLSLSSGRISLSLDPSVTPGADAGLVLSSAIIGELSSASSLSLSSYSSIDLLGAGIVGGTTPGGKAVIDSLSLHAAAIRGIGVGSGSVEFNAGQIQIGGLSGAVAPAGPAENSGSLSFNADNLQLGSGSLDLRGFDQVELSGTKEIRTGSNGSLSTSGALTLTSPLLTSATVVNYSITSAGALKFTGSGSTGTIATAGLGSTLSLTGASVDLSSRIVLPSGSIVAEATTGDLTVSGSLEAGGVARRFKDQVRATNGGAIKLTADQGNVTLAADGSLDVSAPSIGGDAGAISVSAKNGSFALLGSVSGKGGTSGNGGSFALQVAAMPSLAAFDVLLNAGSFTAARDYRITTGDVMVDGLAHAQSYSVSTDSGSITVTGTIDASGATGGSVRLVADENLTLAAGSVIDASGADFDSAGKGGSVVLETRGANGGMVDLQQGSSIDLSVATNAAGSAAAGKFTGTLHLRAPQISGGTDLAIQSVDSTVKGASEVIVEGYKTYDLTSSGGAITSAVEGQVKTDAASFVSNADAIEARILAGSASGLGSILTVRPGAEIVNTTGDLTLGTSTSSAADGDWNLATYRFGGEQVPGILTLRAAGNLVFYNTLSDGFTTSTYTSGLLANNAALGDNAESWSYRLVAGADFSAADTRQVIARQVAADAALGSATGSVKLGKNSGRLIVSGKDKALTSSVLNSTSSAPGYFQVIRTGSGDIDMVAAGDVQLLNPFASIYTAGTQVADPTLGGTFVKPIDTVSGNTGSLGAVQQSSGSPVQYTLGGGDVSLFAGNDIIHLTQIQDPDSGTTKLIYVEDSQREMPVNWLYRRGYVNSATGQFAASRNGDIASTTWWVDFTNFFEGAGALGGGNVTLTAGRDVSNVDAVAPTNARMPAGVPDSSKLVELGGGDVTVTAQRNIDAGVYYVERGQGSLTAGGSIVTNSTRSPSIGLPGTNLTDSADWLPTTLFVGKGSFDVTAGDDVLLGPVANVFLLPQGYSNSFWNKTWFSTYSQDSSLTVSAYGGDVNMRQSVTLPSDSASQPTLQAWFSTQLLLVTTGTTESASFYQPWLRLTETAVDPFSYAFDLMPGTVKLNSFGGDVNIAGGMTLSPAKTGTLEILASDAINGLQQTGINANGNRSWTSSVINLSDADPSAIPGITTPYAYQQIVGTSQTQATKTQPDFLASVVALFTETGSTDGALQERQARHTNGLLHAADDQPLRLYSDSGDISGLTLYSAKFADVLSGQDLRDVSLYLQNNNASDVSIVSASRDIIAYDGSTAGRVESRSTGNEVSTSDLGPAGDIQISGPGTLEVFAGRNLDLGIGTSNADGTGSGITSIGNGRNPYLGFTGADIIAAAGLGDASSLSSSKADFASFIAKYVNTDEGATHLKELGLTPDAFDALDSEAQKQAALQVFYLVLRDTGRNHNDPNSDQYGSYDEGKGAVATLFPGTDWSGDIDTRSRNIRTRNGGDITLMAPGGSLTLAQTVIGSPLVPPGIITEAGGNINIFTDKNVDLGISRIFTLRGGNEIIWSTSGDIAAGSSSKTIQSAPPTRVLIDPQSGDVKTDLAGLATGGGIGVLTTVAGVKASDVDLIAPEGTIDAGDAGIRVSGNLNIAAPVVVNASNISVGGSSSGAVSVASAPSIAAITAASNQTVAPGVTETTQDKNKTGPETQPAIIDAPSDISVEVIGYGGDEGDDEDKDKKDGAEESSVPDSH